MNLSGIRRSLENIDYAWNNPKTYLVLVPGLSLIIQKFQLAKVLPLLEIANPKEKSYALINQNSSIFANICKWHLRGSMIQMVACSVAIKTFAVPLFSLLSILATYELVDTLIKSFRDISLYEFDQKGAVYSITFTNACNIF